MQKIKVLNYTFHIIYQPSSISILMCKHHQKQTIIQALWSFQIIQNLIPKTNPCLDLGNPKLTPELVQNIVQNRVLSVRQLDKKWANFSSFRTYSKIY